MLGDRLKIGEKVIERVKRQGMYQMITFVVAVEQTGIGRVNVLRSRKTIDLTEALRLAEKYNLPVRAGNMRIVLPSGKTLKEFKLG